MNVLHITVVAFTAFAVAACSTTDGELKESKSFDYKAPPVKARPLDVPPELSSYSWDDKYAIPGEADGITSYSEFAKGGSRKRNSVLPPVRNVSLERKDTQRWLKVNDRAENIWPVVKEFWQENGLVIKVENPQAGVIETDWAENRAKVPMDGFRKLFSKLDGMFTSSERDQYHTRLERGKDGNSTEIYISHYGMQEVAEPNEQGFRWVNMPSDPEMEATMLQLLMVKLGGGSGLLDNSKKPAASPDKDSASAAKLNKLADGSQSILLSEPFDKSWRKIGLALEQAGLVLADKDRSKGVYFLSNGKKEAKNSEGNGKTPGTQVTVLEQGSTCEVTVKNAAGASDDETQKVVDALFKALGRI